MLILRVLRYVEAFLFDSPVRRVLAVLFAIMLVRTGIWYIPNLEQARAIAVNPFVNPFTNPYSQYLYWSWLGPFLAWLIGAQSSLGFFLFYFAFAVAFTLLFVVIALSRLPGHTARAAIILFAVLPVSATAYFWVGYDWLTLFLMLLGLTYQHHVSVTLVAGVALGMHHFEQGALAASGLLFANGLSRAVALHEDRRQRQRRHAWSGEHSIQFPVLFLVAVIAGKLILIGLFEHFGATVNSGRLLYLADAHPAVKSFAFHVHSSVWSILGLGWLVALRYLDLGRQTVPFFVTLFCLLGLLPVSGDQTRILGIITFPLIAEYWLFNATFLTQLAKKELAAIFIVWVLMPWTWTWNGVPRWSVFPYDIAYILHKAFGWFAVPPDPSEWPFQ